MRKYNHNYKCKKFNLNKSLKQVRRNRKFKKYRTRKNASALNLSKGALKLKKKHEKYGNYAKYNAPINFSFRENPEEIIRFIDNVKTCFDENRRVYIGMRNIIAIDYDAIVILVSILIRFKSKNIPFNGSLPKNIEPKNKLIDSGFFENLYFKEFFDRDSYKIKKVNSIITHANKKVDSALGKQIIETVSQEIWGEKRVYKGFQRTFVEIMQNSFCHADPLKKGEKHWWMSVNIKKAEKCASFAFIDYGVGVFESLNQKRQGNIFYDWASRLYERFKFKDRAEVLKLILDGELHKTVTGEYFRGKGLPGIKEVMERNQISKLCIITNNVFADVESNDFRILNEDFSGTFIYFELNEDNVYNKWQI